MCSCVLPLLRATVSENFSHVKKQYSEIIFEVLCLIRLFLELHSGAHAFIVRAVVLRVFPNEDLPSCTDSWVFLNASPMPTQSLTKVLYVAFCNLEKLAYYVWKRKGVLGGEMELVWAFSRHCSFLPMLRNSKFKLQTLCFLRGSFSRTGSILVSLEVSKS